jgi:hypothetical protein
MQVNKRQQSYRPQASHLPQARVYGKRSSSKTARATAYAMRLPKIFTNIPLFKSIVALFAISLFLYLYMVVSIVLATVDRKSLEEQIRHESTELTYIETEYSKRISSMSIDTVYAEGYVASNDQSFAKRVVTPTLTLRNE